MYRELHCRTDKWGEGERSRSETRADKDEHNTHNLVCLCVVQEKRSEEQKEEIRE